MAGAQAADRQQRRLLCQACLGAMLPLAPAAWAQASHPQARWHAEAERMRQQALSWGDQPYGAVVVIGDQVAGWGPSRVVLDRDIDAHAERVAIADALRRTGATTLRQAVLYSTSRPCALCEAAAARAGIMRMYQGADLRDAGVPAP